MRQYLIIIFLINLVYSCREHSSTAGFVKPPPDSKIVNIKLIDSLGSITLNVPVRYDTFFSWTDFSDCGKSCDKIKYRFQPKRLPIMKESGFFYINELKDSIEQLTITHSGYFPFHDGSEKHIIGMHNWMKKKESQEGLNEVPVIYDTLEKINGRLFSIIIEGKYNLTKRQYLKKVLASTTIKANQIMFKYELLTRNNDSVNTDFIDRSLNYVRTIHIEKGI